MNFSMKTFFTCCTLFFLVNLNAQTSPISGFWDGFLTLNGQRYTIEIHINVEEGGQLNGFTSVSLPTGKAVEMKINGKVHFDRSVTVREFSIVNEEELQDVQWYKKNFQLTFKRDLWETTLEGYWQEQIPQVIDERTKKGQVFLKKREVKA